LHQLLSATRFQTLALMLSVSLWNDRQTLAYMRSKESFLPTLLKHLHLPPVPEFFSKLTGFDNPDTVKMAMQYLVDRNFVAVAIDKFGKSTPEVCVPSLSNALEHPSQFRKLTRPPCLRFPIAQVHSDLGQLLSELVSSSGGAKSPFTQALMEAEPIEKLFTLALEDGNQSAFTACMPVVNQLLDTIAQSGQTFSVRSSKSFGGRADVAFLRLTSPVSSHRVACTRRLYNNCY
jgi:hypothetical protein